MRTQIFILIKVQWILYKEYMKRLAVMEMGAGHVGWVFCRLTVAELNFLLGFLD